MKQLDSLVTVFILFLSQLCQNILRSYLWQDEAYTLKRTLNKLKCPVKTDVESIWGQI